MTMESTGQDHVIKGPEYVLGICAQSASFRGRSRIARVRKLDLESPNQARHFYEILSKVGTLVRWVRDS